jgi:SAM-dependent methyltransferase
LRTAVVWDVLRAAVDQRAASAGRSSLDVVDAGGGTGGFAVPLATMGHRVTVVDPSPDALAALERRAAEAEVTDRVQAVQGEVAGLLDVAAAGAVDVVVCHGVLEHVDDPAAAMSMVSAVLRPAGLLSLLAANRNAVVLSRAVAGHFAEAAHALDDPHGRWGDSDPTPRRFSSSELSDLLTGAGFAIDLIHGVRIFADLVHGALLDAEPGNTEALLALEAAAADLPAFREVATQLHVLGTRS